MSRCLHLAHFTNTYHPVVSGVVRSISTFRQSLFELGHLVFIFAQEASDHDDEEPFIFRYPAIELPATPDFPLAIPFSPFVEKLLPSLKPDVIHSHHPFLLGSSAARQADSLHLPLVFTFHTQYREYSHYISLSQDLVKGIIDRLISDYMRHCHHIVAPSESIRRMLASEYGVTEQVTVIPTGLDLKLYCRLDRDALRQKFGWDRELVLISVGRLAREKNWRTLLTAVIQVMKQRDHVRFVLIGEGDERKHLEKMAQAAGLSGRVTFAGLVSFDEVISYLTAADLFCFASVSETQGLVTMEAMAAGLPIVAVDAAGTQDVVQNGQEGLLTANDSQALAKAIDRVIEDKALRDRFKAAAKQRIQTFEAVAQARKLISVYEQAFEDKQAGRFVRVEKYPPIVEFVKGQWQKLSDFEKKIMSSGEGP